MKSFWPPVTRNYPKSHEPYCGPFSRSPQYGMVSTLAVGACIAAHEHGLACEYFWCDSTVPSPQGEVPWNHEKKHEHGCVHSRCMVRFWGRANRSFFLASCQVLLFLYTSWNFTTCLRIMLVLMVNVAIPSCGVLGSNTREGIATADRFARACVRWMGVSWINLRHKHEG